MYIPPIDSSKFRDVLLDLYNLGSPGHEELTCYRDETGAFPQTISTEEKQGLSEDNQTKVTNFIIAFFTQQNQERLQEPLTQRVLKHLKSRLCHEIDTEKSKLLNAINDMLTKTKINADWEAKFDKLKELELTYLESRKSYNEQKKKIKDQNIKEEEKNLRNLEKLSPQERTRLETPNSTPPPLLISTGTNPIVSNILCLNPNLDLNLTTTDGNLRAHRLLFTAHNCDFFITPKQNNSVNTTFHLPFPTRVVALLLDILYLKKPFIEIQEIDLIWLFVSTEYLGLKELNRNFSTFLNDQLIDIPSCSRWLHIFHHKVKFYNTSVTKLISNKINTLLIKNYHHLDNYKDVAIKKQDAEQLYILLNESWSHLANEERFLLGLLYFYGLGVTRDTEKGGLLFAEASQNALSLAGVFYGLYLSKTKIAENENKAREIFSKHSQHDPLAQTVLANHLLRAYPNPDNKRTAKQLLNNAADSSFPEALCLLGEFHHEAFLSNNETIEEKNENPESSDAEKDCALSFTNFNKAAKMGHIRARYFLGKCFEYGIGTEKNDKHAFFNYLEAAQHGDPKAQVEVGCCYDRGKGIEQSLKNALHWYNLAAELDIPEALYNVGLFHLEGIGIPKNPHKAVEYFNKAAKQNYTPAWNKLSDCLFTGTGIDKDEFKAEGFLKSSAEENDAEAQYILSDRLINGKGMEKNTANGLIWLTRSAKNDYNHAQLTLGQFLREGILMEKNEKQAFELFEKVHLKENLEGTFELARCFHKGIGTKEDLDKAEDLFKFLKSINYPNADFHLGDIVQYKAKLEGIKKALHFFQEGVNINNPSCLLEMGIKKIKGEEIEQNLEEAFSLIAESAKQNVHDAQFILGYCYFYGLGTKIDYKKSFILFEKAAKQQHILACQYVSNCYLLGHGVEINHEKALEFLKKHTELNALELENLVINKKQKKRKEQEPIENITKKLKSN